MGKSGHIHIISQYGGCVVGLPPDAAQITDPLHAYTAQRGMAELELIDPKTDDLGEWADMVATAIEDCSTEGPVLVGRHRGGRVLVGISKLYGLLLPDAPLHDTHRVVRFPV